MKQNKEVELNIEDFQKVVDALKKCEKENEMLKEANKKLNKEIKEYNKKFASNKNDG